jgi:hypothetical protein
MNVLNHTTAMEMPAASMCTADTTVCAIADSPATERTVPMLMSVWFQLPVTIMQTVPMWLDRSAVPVTQGTVVME